MTATVIRLRHGATWGVVAGIYLLLGPGLIAIAVHLAAQGEPFPPVAGTFAAAAGATAIGVLFLSGARRFPTLRIVPDGIVLDLPGVLRDTVLVPRHQVRHVYLRDAIDIKADNAGWRGWFRRADVPAGPSSVPWLSFGSLTGPTEWRLLLILDPPLAFKDLVRKTTGVRLVAAAVLRLPTYLPRYRTVARALACEPDDLQAAVDALFAAGYPVTRPPISDAHTSWLNGG